MEDRDCAIVCSAFARSKRSLPREGLIGGWAARCAISDDVSGQADDNALSSVRFYELVSLMRKVIEEYTCLAKLLYTDMLTPL